MLRVECTCGKFLKVDDKLLGKKIKCPACGAVQLVKAAAEVAVKSKPKAAPAEDEAITPPPSRTPAPTKKIPAKTSPTAPAPKKQPVRDEEDDDSDEEKEAPRKKKPAKKNNNKMLLLIGGGVAAFLGLVAVAGAGVWLLTRSPAKQPVAVVPQPQNSPRDQKPEETPKEETPLKGETYAIKLFVPHKKGDKREVKVVTTRKELAKPDDLSKLPAEMREDFAKRNFHDRVTMKGEVTTLAVNEKGEETKVELLLNDMRIEYLDGQNNDGMPGAFPPGKIFICNLTADIFSQWTTLEGQGGLPYTHHLNNLIATRYHDLPEHEADALFGTREKQSIGGVWSFDKDRLLKHIRAGRLSDLVPPDAQLPDFTSAVKFVKMSSDGGKEYLDLDATFKTSTKNAEVTGKVQGVQSFRLPRDGLTGAVKKSSKIEGMATVQLPFEKLGLQGGGVFTFKADFAETLDAEIKYLGNFPIKGRPVETNKQGEKLALQLRNPKVEWVAGKNSLKVSVDYVILDNSMPKPNANYVLIAGFVDVNGDNRSVEVQTIRGIDLQKSGKISNPLVLVDVLPKNGTVLRDVSLVEQVPPDTGGFFVHQLRNVAISGTPPGNAPAAKAAVALSNAKAEHKGKSLHFTVDYKFTAGQPDPKKTYRLMARFTAGAKVPAGEVQVFQATGDKLPLATITQDYAPKTDISADARYEVWFVELPAGAKTGTEISSMPRQTGQVSGSGPVVAGNVQFQISNLVAAKKGGGQPGGKKGVPQPQQQTWEFAFSWSLVKGQINKDATYTVYVVLQGGQPQPLGKAVPGSQFQPKGSYTNPPAQYPAGLTVIDVYIVEQLPGQQPHKVSNDARTNVR